MEFVKDFLIYEAGALCGFFIAALMNAARAGQEITIKFEEDKHGTGKEHPDGAGDRTGTVPEAGLSEEDFASLTPEMAQKYERLFHQPEDFIRLGHRMMVVRVPDEAVCPEESKTTPPKDAGFDR